MVWAEVSETAVSPSVLGNHFSLLQTEFFVFCLSAIFLKLKKKKNSSGAENIAFLFFFFFFVRRRER